MVFGLFLLLPFIPGHFEVVNAQIVPEEYDLRGLHASRTNEIVKDDSGIVLAYKELVESVFGPDSVMVRVAKCESDWMQYEIVDNTIKVLRGHITPADVGMFQISVDYHGESAKKLGYNIYKPVGNIGYAKYLYERYGLAPWSASKYCWNK